MTQVSNGGASEQRPEPGQIDLIDLAMELWRGKRIIIANVVIVLMLAVVYLFVAKEKWTSTAILTEPDTAQIAAYYNALKVLTPDSTVINFVDVQQRVGARYNAALSALSTKLENLEEPEELTIAQVVKGRDVPIQVSYVSTSPKEAQQKLTEYLEQVDRKVAAGLSTALKGSIDQQTVLLEASLKNQLSIAEEHRAEQLSKIKEALKYAEEANITKPQTQQAQYVTQDTMFLLGSDALKAMIQNESTRPLDFSEKYYSTKNDLLDLQHLNVQPEMIHAMRYIMKPDIPIRRDSPKYPIVLALAVLLGGIIGAGIVLGRKTIAEYHSRN